MSATFRPAVSWVIAALLLSAPGAAPVAHAQSDEPQPVSVRRPYRGLFAPPADPRISKQSLDVTFSVSGAYDDDVHADSGRAELDSDSRQSGLYNYASAGLVYAKRGQRASLAANAAVGLSYFTARGEIHSAYQSGVDLSAQLAPRTRLGIGGRFSYTPGYRLGLFLGESGLIGVSDPYATTIPDLDLYRSKAFRTATHAALFHQLGRRSSLDVSYELSRSDYAGDQTAYWVQAAGGRFNRALTGNASARIGYSQSVARSSGRPDLRTRRIHNIDAGIDYGRALSLSRRTTFSFSTGSAVLVGDALGLEEASQYVAFRLIGAADLKREIGRTWGANIGYRRGVAFHEGFDEPFISDTAAAELSGLLGRRVRFSSGVDYSFGTVGIGTGNGYDSWSANAGLEYGLFRKLALFARYLYYRYRFDANVAVDPRFVRALERQGVRFGLTASFPLVR